MSTVQAEAFEELLDGLGERLRARGVRGGVRIVGGAAMALLFRDDPSVRVTTDVDAIFQPRPAVDTAIAEIAAERGLPADWMNAAAGAWIARSAPEPTSDEFVIEIADVEELVAMKLAASREQDLHDLVIIARHARLTSPEAIVDIAYGYYGEESLALPWPRDEYLELAHDVVTRAHPHSHP